MVKAAEYWNGHNVVVVRSVVPLGLEFDCPSQKSHLAGKYSAEAALRKVDVAICDLGL